MSALLLPLERTTARTAMPTSRLRALPRPRVRVGRLPFLIVLLATLGLGLVGVLVLNTTIQGRSTELRTLQRQAASLSHEKAALTTEVQQLRSMTALEQRAYTLGMRPNPHPAFILLPEGRILGTPTAVTGAEFPTQRYRTPEQVLAEQTKARADYISAQAAAAKAKADAAAAKAKAEAAEAKAKADAAKAKADAAKAKADAAKAKADRAAASAKPTAPAGTRANP